MEMFYYFFSAIHRTLEIALNEMMCTCEMKERERKKNWLGKYEQKYIVIPVPAIGSLHFSSGEKKNSQIAHKIIYTFFKWRKVDRRWKTREKEKQRLNVNVPMKCNNDDNVHISSLLHKHDAMGVRWWMDNMLFLVDYRSLNWLLIIWMAIAWTQKQHTLTLCTQAEYQEICVLHIAFITQLLLFFISKWYG